jgi:hypothetical protein
MVKTSALHMYHIEQHAFFAAKVELLAPVNKIMTVS